MILRYSCLVNTAMVNPAPWFMGSARRRFEEGIHMRFFMMLSLAVLMVVDPFVVFDNVAEAKETAEGAIKAENSRGRKKKRRRKKRVSKTKSSKRKRNVKKRRRKSTNRARKVRRRSAGRSGRKPVKRRTRIKKRPQTKRPQRRRTVRKVYNPYFKRKTSDKSGTFKGYLPNRANKKTIGYTNRKGKAYFQGDIKLGSVRNLAKKFGKKRGKGARGAVQNHIDRLWPQGIIPYTVSSDLKSVSMTHQFIKDAIKVLNSKTNLKLVKRTNEADYINFVIGDGCASFVGRQGGRMDIDIAPIDDPGGYCDTAAVIHEILHAAGIWHT